MQADLKQAKSEAGVESHIHGKYNKIISSQKVWDVIMFLFMARFYRQVSPVCFQPV